jgi:D-glycero-alpha-D-manno-heptose-7-phosphate kinase
VIIRSTTPSRIDLAGGTLDIWPLYTFVGGGYTVNCGIDVGSEVSLETRTDGVFDVHCEDIGERQTADSLDGLDPEGPAGLIVRALKVYQPHCGLTIRTRNRAPKGTGLGSSSSLLIAASAALWQLAGRSIDEEVLIDIAANIEAQCILVPTGKQDYYAAAYGGVNAIWFGLEGNRREPLLVDEATIRELDDRLTLTFCGESHFSATNNWNMLKSFVEDSGATRGNLQTIKRSSEAMRQCLLGGNLDDFARCLDEEWTARKGLADGVTTPLIDSMMAAAQQEGALASKICGAGGGGCMISYCKPGRRDAVESILASMGAMVIPFRIRMKGIDLRRDD